jgi:hypothetical protein
MTDLKELFTSINKYWIDHHYNHSDVFKEDPKCYTCDTFITDLDRDIADGDTNTCTECFIKELQKTEDRDTVTMYKASWL